MLTEASVPERIQSLPAPSSRSLLLTKDELTKIKDNSPELYKKIKNENQRCSLSLLNTAPDVENDEEADLTDPLTIVFILKK